MKAGLSDVLLFVISLCLVLRFFNSPYQPQPMKAGLMCCSFVIPFSRLVLEYFQQSYPISTYESRIE
jgi:hypothetical protein